MTARNLNEYYGSVSEEIAHCLATRTPVVPDDLADLLARAAAVLEAAEKRGQAAWEAANQWRRDFEAAEKERDEALRREAHAKEQVAMMSRANEARVRRSEGDRDEAEEERDEALVMLGLVQTRVRQLEDALWKIDAVEPRAGQAAVKAIARAALVPPEETQ